MKIPKWINPISKMFRIAFTIWSSFWTYLPKKKIISPWKKKYYQYWPSPWTRPIGHIPPGRLRGLRLRGRFPDDHLSQPASGSQGKIPGSLLFVLPFMGYTMIYRQWRATVEFHPFHLGKFDHDLTATEPGIMVRIGEIIPKWPQDSGEIL